MSTTLNQNDEERMIDCKAPLDVPVVKTIEVG